MADPQALPFDLYIQALPTGSYRVTATNAPSGPASVEIAAPFSFNDLAQLSAVIDGRSGLSVTDQAKRLQAFGVALFNAVINGQVAEAYTASQARAGNGGLNIQLQLDQAGLLRGIPWALLRDPAGGKFTVAPPKSAYNVRSIGGLREAVIRSGVLIPAVVVLIVLLGGAIGGILAVVRASRSDVDLVVTSLHFFPPKPIPGQVTSVSLTIRNNGSTDAGKFDWAWYENPITNQPVSDMSGTVVNGLGAQTSITVKGDIIFGWWGQYNTTAWVNPSNLVQETNKINNFNTGSITTQNNPFLIDWTIFPDTSPITSGTDLKGNEFADWGLSIAPQTTNLTDPNPTCANAIAKIQVSTDSIGDQINRLTTGLPTVNSASGLQKTLVPTQTTAACDSIPLLFSLQHPIGSVTIDFTSVRGGDYTLVVTDASGIPLGTVSKTAVVGSNTLTVTLNNGATPPANVQFTFSGAGGIQINTMTLTKATVTPSS